MQLPSRIYWKLCQNCRSILEKSQLERTSRYRISSTKHINRLCAWGCAMLMTPKKDERAYNVHSSKQTRIIQQNSFISVSPVLAPLSVMQCSALAERGSRDNCPRMLPLNQSERIRAQDVDFTRLKIYLWRVRLATLGKLFKFSSRLTWRIGMSVACLHFH